MKDVELCKVKPYIRWAGGKKWLIPSIDDLLPTSFNNYHEPFLGGGAVFLHLYSIGLIKRAYLNDVNADLINCYRQLKNNSTEFRESLLKHKNTKPYYYKLRAMVHRNKVEQATQFLHLNRTGFNGIYRVNRQGEYNVPYGYKTYSQLYDMENLSAVSKSLKKATLLVSDFFETLINIKANDLVFIDPPYTIAHEHNGFIEYNEKIFSWEDQKRLVEFISEVKRKGAYYIMTNASHSSIRHLFKKLEKPKVLERYTLIGGRNANRGVTHELLYTNCY